ncbi:hypothetical protein EXS54_01370 [Patescibacteria group bacterium]|nr:hypothetical protein [Patescibacteria group bacterium]
MDDRPGPKKHIAIRTGLLVVQVSILAAVVYFLWDRAGALLADFRIDDIRGQEGWLALSGLLYVAFYGVAAWHWQLVARLIDSSVHTRLWLSSFAAQPFKYLPSSLFTFSFRAKYAHDMGFSLRKSTKAQLLEYANLVASALVLSGIIFAFDYDLILGTVTAGLTALALAAGLVHTGSVKIPKLGTVPTRREAGLLLLCAAGWVLAGLAFWTVLQAFHASVGIFPAIAINALAFSVGILAVFAPGGLGVREVIYAANGIANPPIVLWRLITLIVDVVTGVAAIGAIRWQKRRGR